MKLISPLPSFVRRSARHVFFAVCGIVMIDVVVLWANATGDDNIMNLGPSGTVGMSLGAAYAAYVFLALSLLVGPWTLWRRRRRPLPVSSYLRRDFGIWATVFALLHTIVGLQVYPDVSMWNFFFYPVGQRPLFPVRLDFFGLANHLGLIAALVLLFLLCLSSNFALRRLQAERWKKYQRWAYLAAAVTLIHGVMYLFMGQRTWGFVFMFSVISGLALTAQLWGVVMTKRRTSVLSSSQRNLAE